MEAKFTAKLDVTVGYDLYPDLAHIVFWVRVAGFEPSETAHFYLEDAAWNQDEIDAAKRFVARVGAPVDYVDSVVRRVRALASVTSEAFPEVYAARQEWSKARAKMQAGRKYETIMAYGKRARGAEAEWLKLADAALARVPSPV